MEIKKQYLKSKSECKVTFKIEKEIIAGAETASIAGEFNNWDSEATPLKILKTGEASVTVSLEADREYQYKVVLNNSVWVNDPSADKTATNEFGELNSVVVL